MIPELDMWKGFFIKGDAVTDKLVINLYLKIFGDKILGFGRDKIGIFLTSGQISPADSSDSDQRKKVDFCNYYEREYIVSYSGRIEGEEIVASA